MDKPFFSLFTEFDEGPASNTGQDVFDPAEIDITDLVTALGDEQFMQLTFSSLSTAAHAQLLRKCDLLGHGGIGFFGSVEPCPRDGDRPGRKPTGLRRACRMPLDCAEAEGGRKEKSGEEAP